MAHLSLGSFTIRDFDGLYSLNDLHQASGSEAKHRPAYFLGNEQTQTLIAEIEKAGIPAIRAKQKIGTYACRELVIAYAAWISPAFHLQVIRVFLANAAPPSDTDSRPTMHDTRWLLTIGSDLQPSVQPIEPDAVIASPRHIRELLEKRGYIIALPVQQLDLRERPDH